MNLGNRMLTPPRMRDRLLGAVVRAEKQGHMCGVTQPHPRPSTGVKTSLSWQEVGPPKILAESVRSFSVELNPACFFSVCNRSQVDVTGVRGQDGRWHSTHFGGLPMIFTNFMRSSDCFVFRWAEGEAELQGWVGLAGCAPSGCTCQREVRGRWEAAEFVGEADGGAACQP